MQSPFDEINHTIELLKDAQRHSLAQHETTHARLEIFDQRVVLLRTALEGLINWKGVVEPLMILTEERLNAVCEQVETLKDVLKKILTELQAAQGE